MSAMKSFQADGVSAMEGAYAAAGLPTAHERIAAYRSLCAALGEASARYSDPQTVARLLVELAASTYAGARTRKRVLSRG